MNHGEVSSLICSLPGKYCEVQPKSIRLSQTRQLPRAEREVLARGSYKAHILATAVTARADGARVGQNQGDGP